MYIPNPYNALWCIHCIDVKGLLLSHISCFLPDERKGRKNDVSACDVTAGKPIDIKGKHSGEWIVTHYCRYMDGFQTSGQPTN